MNESYESSKRMPQEAQGAYSWISSWMQCVLQRERESLKMMMSRVSSDMRDEIVTDDASRNPTCNRVMKRNHNNITTIRQEYNNTLQSRKGKTNPKISLNLCSPVASLSISSFHFAWCLNMSLTKLCIISWGNESHLNTCRFIWYCLFNARVTLIILSIHASCIQGSVTPLFYLISVIVFYLKHSCDTFLWHRTVTQKHRDSSRSTGKEKENINNNVRLKQHQDLCRTYNILTASFTASKHKRTNENKSREWKLLFVSLLGSLPSLVSWAEDPWVLQFDVTWRSRYRKINTSSSLFVSSHYSPLWSVSQETLFCCSLSLSLWLMKRKTIMVTTVDWNIILSRAIFPGFISHNWFVILVCFDISCFISVLAFGWEGCHWCCNWWWTVCPFHSHLPHTFVTRKGKEPSHRTWNLYVFVSLICSVRYLHLIPFDSASKEHEVSFRFLPWIQFLSIILSIILSIVHFRAFMHDFYSFLWRRRLSWHQSFVLHPHVMLILFYNNSSTTTLLSKNNFPFHPFLSVCTQSNFYIFL